MRTERKGLVFGLMAVALWGPWGALIDLPAKAGFPETLGYVVWSLTMIPPALVALGIAGWKLERDARSIALGCLAGFLGAGGQLLLFKLLRLAPAYLVFPFVALSPAVTIALALAIGKERASRKGWTGIVLALVAGVLLSWSKPTDAAASGSLWIVLAGVVLLAWGAQGYVLSHANRRMQAESIFFYMAVTGLLLAPVAWAMTDFGVPGLWEGKGPWLAAGIQSLNAVGALLIVYAFRHGKAIIISPLTNAGAPVLTVIVSLAMYGTMPLPINIAGIVLATIGTVLMTQE